MPLLPPPTPPPLLPPLLHLVAHRFICGAAFTHPCVAAAYVPKMAEQEQQEQQEQQQAQQQQQQQGHEFGLDRGQEQTETTGTTTQEGSQQ